MEVKITDDSVLLVELYNNYNYEVLWLNDAHIDSKLTDRKYIKKVFDSNPEAYIVISADFFDAMGQKSDKRYQHGNLLDQHIRADYLNALVEDAFEYLSPYANRIICFNQGNHETLQTKFYGSNPTQSLATLLNHTHNVNIPVMDSAGWIIFRSSVKNQHTRRFIIYWGHKPISGGQRSKGMLSVDIAKGRQDNVDLYISEHVHDNFIHRFNKECIDSNYKRKYTSGYYAQLPSSKEEYLGKKIGYHTDKNFSANPAGMLKVHVSFNREGDRKLITPQIIWKENII